MVSVCPSVYIFFSVHVKTEVPRYRF